MQWFDVRAISNRTANCQHFTNGWNIERRDRRHDYRREFLQRCHGADRRRRCNPSAHGRSSNVEGNNRVHDSAGVVDVVVIVKSTRAVLPGGYRYVAPEVVNQPPVITPLTVKGIKPREPEEFADLDETVRVLASISDAETPV